MGFILCSQRINATGSVAAAGHTDYGESMPIAVINWWVVYPDSPRLAELS
jgi:hypothetical protein